MSQQGTPPVPPQQQQQQQQQQQAQQQRFDQLMTGLGQAIEAMARVGNQTAQQQVQLTAALQNLTAAQAASAAAPATAEEQPRPATTPFDTGGKILKPPEAFSPATLEEGV